MKTTSNSKCSAMVGLCPKVVNPTINPSTEPGQYYRVHSDYGASQKRLACGPRVLTFFMYLSDVEEGGETHFPRVDIKAILM